MNVIIQWIEWQLILGAVDNIQSTGESILMGMQVVGGVVAAISIGIGAYFLMAGGARGRMSSIGWFVGAAGGLVMLLGALGISQWIESSITF
ncbi:hypothetical protein [Natribacillus halophilus]|uniref:TrbC/VIRB2 family protein n=1 Tax=Natribacillus halophilus TaxID=549003 RepID=A0A1G8KJP8_9BACI|nr:hypothetical protein [Natribacillus halophilus]SDI43618.1 hypothetical protein SAMN04488123_102147 [Natribacillus halophilus]